MKQIKHQSGISLLEVLMSLILFSIGLLGTAALQVKSQQSNNNSYFATQATVIAHDMSERIRSNIAGQQAGYYDLPLAKKHSSCYSLSGCSLLEMAQNDMFEWAGDGGAESVSTKLPEGSAVVCLDSTPNDGTAKVPACDGSGSLYAIKVWWHDSEQRRMITTVGF